MSTQEANATSGGPCSTKLCQRCQGACFDDSLNEGFVTTSEAGKEKLQFPQDSDEDDDRDSELFTDFELHDSLPTLPVLSSSTECDFCCFLRSAILDSNVGRQLEEQEIVVELSYGWCHYSPKMSFALCGLCITIKSVGEDDDDEEDEVLETLRFTIDSHDEECKRWLRVQTTPSPDFLCQQNIDKIRARLDKCPPPNSDFFPTRVIDLGADPEGDELKLVTGYKPHHYAALSYCWGTPEEAQDQFKTLRSNLSDRHSGFQLSKVSRVIKDAVAVCRALGIRYLWIDAVCIIQDDAHDWEHEAALMAMIFRSAHFVIAAAASTSCNEGFLSFSRPCIHLPFESKLKPGLQGTYRIVLQRDDAHDYNRGTLFWDLAGEDYLASRWRTRGWVHQEKVAARTILLFGSTGLWAQFHGDSDLSKFIHFAGGDLNYKSWFTLVTFFSGSQLTHQTDRLPAVSGLAKIYSSALQDQYLAGLWEKDLYQGLLWSRVDTGRTRSELVASLESPDPYIAPSWSWARQAGSVAAKTGAGLDLLEDWEIRRQEFTLLDARTELAGSYQFGQVRGGQLTLRSKASKIPSNWGFEEDWFFYDSDFVTLDPDWDNDKVDTLGGLVMFLVQSCIEKRPSACTCDESAGAKSRSSDTREERLLTGLDALDMRDHTEKHDDDQARRHETLCVHCKEELIMYGLLLHPAKKRHKFFRVGLFVSDPKKHARGGLDLCENWETRTVEII